MYKVGFKLLFMLSILLAFVTTVDSKVSADTLDEIGLEDIVDNIEEIDINSEYKGYLGSYETSLFILTAKQDGILKLSVQNNPKASLVFALINEEGDFVNEKGIIDEEDLEEEDFYFSTELDSNVTNMNFPISKGTYYLIMGGDEGFNDQYSFITKFTPATSATPTKAIAASNVTIANNYKKDDVITFKNLEKGSTYTIYKDSKKKDKLKSFKATGTTAKIDVKQLGASSGSVYITATKPNYSESATTKVAYKAEKLPALSVKNVTITNNVTNDKISFKELTKGFTYTIYTDASLKKKLTSFTATGTTKSLTVKQVGAKAGSVYVVVSKKGYQSSAKTKVSFKGQPTAALPSKNVKVTNAKAKDTIKFTGLKKGTTYVIYKDAKKKTKLASFKATGATKTVTVKQLGTKAGKIYITAQASGYSVSSLTTVSYSKQK